MYSLQTKQAARRRTSRNSVCSLLQFNKQPQESQNFTTRTLKIELNPFIVQKKKAEAKKVNANSQEIRRINPKSFLTLRSKLADCTIELSR